jgi:ubiquinone/menaquinone biosynthesis C-methylase UbiE
MNSFHCRIMQVMTSTAEGSNWNSLARANAAQRWRQQSAFMGREVTRAIFDAARAEAGMCVLDVACGTGEPAISIATKLGNDGMVLGIDTASEPLMTARERATQRGLAKLMFQRADAHHLPFRDNAFDCITSRLGVMFFSDLPRALGEMRRVLRPGRKLTMLAWGPVSQPYFEATIGTLLHLLPGACIPESAQKMFAFGQPGLLEAACRTAGFTSAAEHFTEVPWIWPGSAEEVWEYFQQTTVPFAPLLQTIPPERSEEINNAVIRAISRYRQGDAIEFTAKINIAQATK